MLSKRPLEELAPPALSVPGGGDDDAGVHSQSSMGHQQPRRGAGIPSDYIYVPAPPEPGGQALMVKPGPPCSSSAIALWEDVRSADADNNPFSSKESVIVTMASGSSFRSRPKRADTGDVFLEEGWGTTEEEFQRALLAPPSAQATRLSSTGVYTALHAEIDRIKKEQTKFLGEPERRPTNFGIIEEHEAYMREKTPGFRIDCDVGQRTAASRRGNSTSMWPKGVKVQNMHRPVLVNSFHDPSSAEMVKKPNSFWDAMLD